MGREGGYKLSSLAPGLRYWLQALAIGSQLFCKSLKTLKSVSRPLAISAYLPLINLALVAPWLMSRGPSRRANGPRLRNPVLYERKCWISSVIQASLYKKVIAFIKLPLRNGSVLTNIILITILHLSEYRQIVLIHAGFQTSDTLFLRSRYYRGSCCAEARS